MVRNRETKKVLGERAGSHGYRIYELYVNAKKHKFLKHRIVACIFIPIPKDLLKEGYNQEYLEVNHKDGNKLNCDISNLEWATHKENMEHAAEHYLMNPTSNRKIDEKVAKVICERLSNGEMPTALAKDLSIPRDIVYNIYRGVAWKYIARNYNFNRHPKPQVSDEIIISICNDLQRGTKQQKEIAEKYGFKESYVRQLKAGRFRKDIVSQFNLKERDWRFKRS